MKKLKVDSGVQVYALPGGTLCFNPADPALHLRLEELDSRVQALNIQDLTVSEADSKLKQLLNWVLGAGNDVDKALGGVHLFAPGSNGQPVLQNLLDALKPILKEGAERCAQQQEQW